MKKLNPVLSLVMIWLPAESGAGASEGRWRHLMRLLKPSGLVFAIFLLPLLLWSAAAQQNAKAGKGDAASGKQIFLNTGCPFCHYADSDEIKRPPAPSLKGLFQKPTHKLTDGTEHKEHTDEMIRKIVTEGTKSMGPRGAILSDEELDDLLAYLHTI